MVVSSIPGRRAIGLLVLGWVTILGQAYHLGITSLPGQLSLLPCVGWECGDALRLGSKGRMAHTIRG